MRARFGESGGLSVLLALSIAEPVSWGVLYYAYPVFIGPMEAEFGWSQGGVTGAFSLSLLAAGLAAVPIGRWLDDHDPRWLMTSGSIGAVILLIAWSRIESLLQLYLVWIGLGVVSAAVLYEPAFATIARWFSSNRARALAVLSFGGGMASVIFLPLSASLVDRLDWREAVLVLTVILAAVTIPLHALFVRFPVRPLTSGGARASAARLGTRKLVHLRSFQRLSIGSVIAMFVLVATSYHIVPLLIARGFSPAYAGLAAGAIGLFALPGRLITAPLADRLPANVVLAGIFACQAAGLLFLLLSGTWAIWAFVVLFGLGFGAISPVRAALVADLYGVAAFAGISGVLAMFVALARAGAPIATSLFQTRRGYDALVVGLVGMLLVAMLFILDVSAGDEHTARRMGGETFPS